MASLRDSFDGDHDHDDAPPPAILVRPMEARDAWKMVLLERRASAKNMKGVDQLALKKQYDDMIPHTLVAVKNGAVIGFGIASSEPGLFQNKRGILKIVTNTDEEQTDCTRRLIRGFALQVMATGQKALEICVRDGQDIVEDVCSDYQAACTKSLKGHTPLGQIKALVFTIDRLSENFGYKSEKNRAPKGPNP